MARWRIHCFGELRLVGDGRAISRFATRKTAELLAYLALHLGRDLSRDHLAALLWPDAERARARHRLTQALYSLRGLLDLPGTEPALTLSRASAGLSPAVVTTDVADFTAALAAARPGDPAARERALAVAVETYGGDLLADFPLDWVLAERSALSERFFEAVRDLAAARRAAGDLAGALECLQLGLRYEPLREELHRDRMRLLVDSGRPEAALRQYRELTRLLAGQLASEPAAVTRALAHEIEALLRAGDTLHTPGLPSQATVVLSPLRPLAPSPFPRLPTPRTRFFGRERELADLATLIRPGGARLVTLTGPGGSGKTRLAVELLRGLDGEWQGAVAFVPLAGLADARWLPEALRDALGLPASGEETALDRVVAALGRRPVLLVLDNLEHLLEGSAALVAELLSRVETLVCLATSRQRLGLSGEQEYPVAPLPIPEATDTEALEGCASVRLFADRARRVRPDFRVTPANARAVAGVCARLDGLPLAIELAAAHIRTVTPGELLSALSGAGSEEGESSLRLLTGGPRDAPSRLRALRDAIAWSYDLLDEGERRLFRALSVFAGGFTAEAAEAVGGEALIGCGGFVVGSGRSADPRTHNQQPTTPLPVFDLLGRLVEKSLVVVEERDGETRYRLLETIREFGRERLREAGEEEGARDRHAAYFGGMAERAGPELRGPMPQHGGTGWSDWYPRLEREIDNLRSALGWWTGSGRVHEAARMALALCPFWGQQGYGIEGHAALLTLLERREIAGEPALRAQILDVAGDLAWQNGQYPAAESHYRDAVALHRQRGDLGALGWSLRNLGCILADAGHDVREIRLVYEEALTRLEAAGETRRTAPTWGSLGLLMLTMGDLAAGRACWERVLAIKQEHCDEAGSNVARERLSRIAYDQGDYEAARAYLEQRIALRRELACRAGVRLPPRPLHRERVCLADGPAVRRLWEEDMEISLAAAGPPGADLNRGVLHPMLLEEGEFAAARRMLEESQSLLRREVVSRWTPPTLRGLAEVARCEGRFAEARALLEESLARATAAGSPGERVAARQALGILASDEGDRAGATALIQEGCLFARSRGARLAEAFSLCHLGLATLRGGDLPAARARLEEGLALQRQIGDQGGLALALAVLGRVLVAQGEPEAARPLLKESLNLRVARGARPGVAECLEGLAAALAATGSAERGARLLGAAAAVRRALGAPLPPADRPEQERLLAALHGALGKEAFAAAWAAGEALSWKQAAAEALDAD